MSDYKMTWGPGGDPPANLYVRNLPTTRIDVYRVLHAFNVIDPCIQHAIKKLLFAGARGGGKTEATDVKEAVQALVRWGEMRGEEDEAAK